MRFVTKKRVAAAVVAVAVASGGLAAYAYFTASGTADGSAGVGTSVNFSVTGSSGSGLPSTGASYLYPGGPAVALTYRITNPSSGHQAVRTVSVAVAQDGNGDAVTPAGASITGCTATWFTAGSSTYTASPAAGGGAATLTDDLAGGDYITGSTSVTMGNVGSSQDVCKNATPKLTVTVG